MPMPDGTGKKHAKQQQCSENRKPHFIAAKFRHSRMDISFRADVHALLTLETFSRRLDQTALWKSQFCRTVFRACPASFDAVFTVSCQCQERQCRKQGKDCTHRTEKTAEKAFLHTHADHQNGQQYNPDGISAKFEVSGTDHGKTSHGLVPFVFA